MKLVMDWTDEDGEQNDEVCTITLDGQEVIKADHGPHGWDGMTGIRDALVKAAHIAGWDIEIIGEEGV